MALGTSLVVADGATASNVIPGKNLEDIDNFTIYAPESVGTAGTITVQVSAIRPEDGTPVWVALQIGGSDVTLTAGKAVTIDVGGVGALRLSCSDPGTDITFKTTFRPWNGPWLA